MTKRVSYAQNGEDIVLERAFTDHETGFYIDVGAADPRADSVTKLFYDRGWRGINIEPQESHWRDLEYERPRDTNLHCALGAERGRGTFVENRDIPGWSTLSEAHAARYREAGMSVDVMEVEVRTLADVCRDHAPEVIDFMKIDVEGFERQVLLGNDWRRYRPRAIVIEATEPESWEGILLEARYRKTLFDGVNFFYVREEDDELVPALSAPPNILDQFLCWLDADRIAALEAQVAELEAEIGRKHAAADNNDLRAALHASEATRASAPSPADAPPRRRRATRGRDEQVPLPPLHLITRVGASPDDPIGSYLEIGQAMIAHLRRLLPDDRPLEGARILDFGCGAGRALRYIRDIPGVSLAGCDIHEESIAWLEEFMPEVNAFVNQELPPLPLPDASIDVVWAGSVFTHLDESWSGWIAEMHRILDRGGILVASFLASGMSEAVAHEAWDEDRIGMNTLMRGNPWDRGGPSVLLSPWWIREHWGRAFDVLQIEPEGFGAHGAAVLRKRDVTIRPDELERLSDDPREVAALRHNVEQLHTESLRYRRILADPSSAGLTDDQAQAQLRAARLQIDSLRSELATMRSSRSWRVTRPLRFVSVRVRRIGNRS